MILILEFVKSKHILMFIKFVYRLFKKNSIGLYKNE